MSVEHAGVSVVIRNRNESTHLALVLRALSLQDVPHETILVDNESTDDSVAVASKAGARIVSIPRGAFTYGRALNLGLGTATGELCVILSAHAFPVGPGFLRECVKPFSDPRVAAVRCLLSGKKADQERWLAPEVLEAGASVDAVVSKGPLASGCAIRRSVWAEIPFDEGALAAEEKLWTLEVLAKGYTVHSPCSAVYAYLKPLSSRQSILKNGRELIEISRRTGVRVGFARKGWPAGLIDVGRAVLRAGPTAAARVVADECLKTYVRFRLERETR